MSTITRGRLLELLDYDPASGAFTHKSRRRGRASAVSAGSINEGYVIIRLDGRRYKAHRLAWLYVYGRWPLKVIDHIDGNPANNRISNLREATVSQNAANSKLSRSNVTGFRGVSFYKRKGKYQATASVGGVFRHLGYYSTPEDAAAAVRRERQAAFGSFARE